MSSKEQLVKLAVRETYARVAAGGKTCCGGGADVVATGQKLGYASDDADRFADVANLGLGCGAPLNFANLQPGETVLDLGSGAGFDAFLAARAMQGTGQVYGVDMTPEMIARARANAAKLGYDNVEFRLGEIEALPIADASVDLVISNCVLNLVPNKRRAFAEMARVLKPGGRAVVSDIVLVGQLPEPLEDNLAAYCGCASGAWPKERYLAGLAEVGLTSIEVLKEVEARDLLTSAACCDDSLGALLEGVLASVTIKAVKP